MTGLHRSRPARPLRCDRRRGPRLAHRSRHLPLRARVARALSGPLAAGAEARQRRGGQPHPEARHRDAYADRAAGRQHRPCRRPGAACLRQRDRRVAVAAEPRARDRHAVEHRHRRGRRRARGAAPAQSTRQTACSRSRWRRRAPARSAATSPPMPAARPCSPMATRANSASASRSCCRPARCSTISGS